MLCPWAMSFFFKNCALPLSLLFHAHFLSCLGPQCCLYNLLEGHPEKSWPLGGKYCIISNPSRYSGFHFLCPITCATSASLSEPTRVGDRHTMPARSPSAGIPSKAIGLPGIMFATLGVSPAGLLGPNPYHPSPKVTNIPLDQISTTLLF